MNETIRERAKALAERAYERNKETDGYADAYWATHRQLLTIRASIKLIRAFEEEYEKLAGRIPL